MNNYINIIENAVKFIKTKTDIKPSVGIILGSGLGDCIKDLKNINYVNYNEINDFPVSTVKGHKGRFVFGIFEDVPVVLMQGRFHYYEGYSMEQIAIPVRTFKELGIKYLFITNAAGGISSDLSAGDLMVIKDHINMSGHNPLIGTNYDEFGPRFPDLSNAYDKDLRDILKDAFSKTSVKYKEGVYAMMAGPSYETPAEINMLKVIGADAVGMSTVPEVIAAVHCGIKVAAISCITNMAAGITKSELNHKEVLETAAKTEDKLDLILKNFIYSIKSKI